MRPEGQEEKIMMVQKIFEERGRKALEMARKEMLQEDIECKEAREALRYFMTEYWQDLARPALLSLCCEAVGGNPEKTIPIAVPLSLISGGIDIHDDIIDQSKIKGSRPTVLGKFGKHIALLVGDALIFKGLTMLNEAIRKGVSHSKIRVISGIIKRMFFELGDAEALELQLRGRIDITPEEYMRVVKKKAADVEAHTHISAILGGATKDEIEALSEYGRLLGMILILRDDLIDMIDFEEARNRVKREHLPLPVIYALQNSETKSDLRPILLKGNITKRDAKKILEVAEKAGGLRQVGGLMRELTEKASICVKRLKNEKVLTHLAVAMLLPLD